MHVVLAADEDIHKFVRDDDKWWIELSLLRVCRYVTFETVPKATRTIFYV